MNSIYQNYSAVIICTFGWICYLINDLLIKHLSVTFSSVQLNFFNFSFGLIPFFIFLYYEGGFKNLRTKNYKIQILSSLIRLLTTISFFYAISTLPLAELYSVFFSIPIFVSLLSIILLKEKISFKTIFFIFIGFVGVLIIFRPGFKEFSPGLYVALLAVSAYSFLHILVRKHSNTESPLAFTFYQISLAIIVTGILTFFVFGFKSYTISQLILNFICGILHIGAILSLMIAYQMAEAHKLAYVQYIQIFLGFILGYLIFNEVPGIFIYLGCSLILISVTFIVKEAKNSRL